MEDYDNNYMFLKSGDIHTLSDRIPVKWKEILILLVTSFLVVLLITNWIVATIFTFLITIGYTLFRFASWIYYSEIKIDQKSGKLIRLKKILNRIQSVDLISNKFDPNRFEFREVTRSGKTKFLMNYQTHKNHELLILKNAENKNLIENYIHEQISY